MSTECLEADAQFTAGVVAKGTLMTEDLLADTSMLEDWFATMPVLPVVASQQVPDEEELHTSFEHAISDRLCAVNKQLSLMSGPLTDPERAYIQVTKQLSQSSSVPNSEIVVPSVVHTNPLWLGTVWQRNFMIISLALMFLLVGFDLMGLLVLHAH